MSEYEYEKEKIDVGYLNELYMYFLIGSCLCGRKANYLCGCRNNVGLKNIEKNN